MIDIFKALSEENRLRILALLLDKEMCVCEIEVAMRLTQSNVSRHLNELRKSGVLESYKKAQWAYYRISDTFKFEESELWEYLQRKLVYLKSYKADQQEYIKCTSQNLCDS